MKKIAILALATLGLAAAGTTQADEALAKKSGCLTCHNITGAKKLGPSLHDAAVKNGGDEGKILAVLNDKKKHGAVKASADDKKVLAKWVSTLK
jgi:cytochrome c